MQVSWIDPEDVASLAESLRRPPPRPAPPPSTGHGLSLLEEIEEQPEALDGTAAELPDTHPSEEEFSGGFHTPSLPEPPAALSPESGAAPDLQALRQRLQAIRERAMDAGLLPGAAAVVRPPEPAPPPVLEAPPAPVSAPAPFQVPLGSVMARLEAFAAWADRSLDQADVFVVDDRDDLLWGPQEQAGLVLSALMAQAAATRSSALSACEGAHALHQALPTGRMLTVIPCGTRLGMMQVAVVSAEALSPDQSEALRGALTAAMDAEE
jgi:hypothetical protein